MLLNASLQNSSILTKLDHVRQVSIMMAHAELESRKNNFPFRHPIFTQPSAAPQSRNPQRRPGYACGFAQSFATKSGANLSANSAKLFLREP